MTFKQKTLFIWRLSLKQKAWLLGCVISSLFCLLIVYVIPSRHLNYFLGEPLSNRQLCVLVTPTQMKQARKIASLMRSVANNVPWPCKCLAQALSVRWLLKLEGIPSVIYLGAMFSAKEENNSNMKAHAWLSVGSSIIIGHTSDNYAVVGTFVSLKLIRD